MFGKDCMIDLRQLAFADWMIAHCASSDPLPARSFPLRADSGILVIQRPLPFGGAQRASASRVRLRPNSITLFARWKS